MSYDPNKASATNDIINAGGYSREQYLDTSKVPGSVDFLKIDPNKKYVVDIIPFKITSKDFPGYAELKAKFKDQRDIFSNILRLWVHKSVGPANANIVCPAKNYGKPCPVCEDLNAKLNSNQLNNKDPEYTNLKAKERGIFVVADIEDEGKFKLLDYSWYYFAKNLEEKRVRANSEGEQINLYDISEKGVSAKFYPTEAQATFRRKDGSASAGQITDISFIPRRKGYNENVFDIIPTPDKMIRIKTYEEIDAIYHGAESEVIESDDFQDEKESEPVKVEREEPKAEERSSAEETRARRRAKVEVSGSVCPFGHVFGKDNLDFVECDKCEVAHSKVYTDCTSKYEAEFN